MSENSPAKPSVLFDFGFDMSMMAGESSSRTTKKKTVTDKPTVLTEELKKSFIEEITRRHEEIKEVPLGIHDMGTWSSSKLKTLEKCPFQYYLKYVLKFKVPETLLAQSDPLSANVGKAAHAILEHVVIGKPIDKAYSETKTEYLSKGLLTEQQWAENVDTLHYNITRFKERIDALSNQHKITRVLTELRIAITKDYEPTGFFSENAWLRGVVDLIVMLECMDIIILDHKTGGGEGSVNMYKSQLDWYKVLFHFGIQKIQGAQTGVHFIKAGEVKMADYTEHPDIENKLKNVLELSIEGAIDSLIEKGFFKHVRGPYCKWCEYDAIGCKSGELKPLELSTKRFFIPIKPA